MPFIMFHKDGKSKLVRIAIEGDPNEGFQEIIEKDQDQYDQIVFCFEGRIPIEGQKYDAIIVKGFDTSQEHGLMFFQRFRGIESGSSFMKIGNPGLISKDVPLPVKVIDRSTNKTIEEPYVSIMSIKDSADRISKVNVAGHENASFLSNNKSNPYRDS